MSKMSVRVRWEQAQLKRRIEKDKRIYQKYAGVRISRPPRPMRTPIVCAIMILAGIIYYTMTMLLVKQVVTGFIEYCMITTSAVLVAVVIVLREGTIASAGRTFKIKVGDMPAVCADGHIPGGIIKTLKFAGVDDKGKVVEETRHFEIGWGGPLKRWPFKGRGPAFILLCQYGIDDKPGASPQAGFMFGDEYVCPLVPDAYRMDMLEASRDERYAKMLRATEEIGGRIHSRTWIVLGTLPMALPEGTVIEGPAVSDMELWHEKRLRFRTTDTLHGVGIDEKITKSMGMK